ncbi:MAG TPA: ATP-binding protein [Candidatus Paceibacterota bacterium]
MFVFKREIEERIREYLFRGKIVLIFGPRQAGKTTLVKKLLSERGDEEAYFNCELAAVRQHFIPGEPQALKKLVGDRPLVVFDEAQTITDIGLILKTFVDTYPETQIIATGSSSFDLSNKTIEPLTGRAVEFMLYPLSLKELRTAFPSLSRDDLDEFMRVGTYPGVVAERDMHARETFLKNLTTSYLYKDVYLFESIRNPRVFEDLIRMLALQIGSLVSVNELAQALGVSRATVEKYLRLLEQTYIIRIVRSYSRNPRNEMKRGFKVFFIDVGIRNAVIDNVAPLAGRSDRGALFENFFMTERFKRGVVDAFPPGLYFWRDRKGNEVDVVEERAGALRAFECKWSEQSSKALDVFRRRYPDAAADIMTPDDLLQHAL